MRPVSAAYLRTVRGSHTMTARARVCTTFQTGTQPTGTIIPLFSGDVFFDAHADVRATLDMTTDGHSMWPTRANSLLAPYGNEIFVERGIQYGNGTTEWVSLGYYRIESPEQQSTPPDGPIHILGRDRMAGIVDARLLAPVQFGASATYGSVVSQLVLGVYPTATIQWDSGDTSQVGRALVAEEDRFGFLDDLVTAKGKIWYWDYRGVLVIRDQPDSTAAPVFDVDSGAGGVLVDLARRLTRERVYNAVVATGEAADTNTPVRAVAVDNNPNSPTYFYGRFGPVPRFFASPLLLSTSSATTAAQTMLRKQLGLPYTIDFTAVPNAALEPWDTIRIRYSSRYGSEKHIIDQLRIPLVSGDPMTGTTREQTVVLIGAL